MKKTGYTSIVQTYIRQHDEKQPILTEQVSAYVAAVTYLDPAVVKRTVNVILARLEKQGDIVRITKGMYCKTINTVFGNYTPDADALYCNRFLRDANDHIIGYETGLSGLNRLGFVTQMPAKRCIATNAYDKRIPKHWNITLRKPPIPITTNNHRYLQLLDVVQQLHTAPVDTVNPTRLVCDLIQTWKLDTNILIRMARQHYDYRVLCTTIDIVLGDIHESA
ncbi:hypothetical protein AB840_06545 [Megasphaera cerevisiae DSM 20462]|uniref:Uncharacterized protein n=1 Tax=Megasphaera cerevisiae DSM 20462 TaxID=1122219 RepID=A0A0J6ZPE3_9FIRM|nr:DUF6088 family protein [Megasphaera cerevisiae]KMO86761.1 hypothetical protein AB840_06545 [Megasphaera cerevisiae DSM 20462]SKA27266.1 hypothetical protein SAMN05660900_03123 [Megasphaera cerevisiae DSM 20462]